MSFMSADELGIPEDQREALIKTLIHLENGCLEDISMIEMVKVEPRGSISRCFDKNELKRFHMNSWNSATECGTICCIGGTAEVLGGIRFNKSELPENLIEVFYPSMRTARWNEISASHGARALRNYLEKGKPDWGTVMKNHPPKANP